MFGLFSRKISVEAVEKGKYLDKAIEKPSSFFIDCRLKNPPRKVFVGIWLIFFEDEQYIYWGKPRFKRLFSDKRVLDELYKTNKAEVKSLFPQYSVDFYSIELKHKIREAVAGYEKMKDGVIFRDFYLNPDFRVNIENGSFQIKAKGSVSYTAAPYSDNAREEKSERGYLIKLELNTLDIQSVEPF